jgi:pimeloyl-ACP methyl ester carboxylesterase
MIHAGVADSRQWNHEFARFAEGYRVVRYDMRGYGRSEPVDAEFSHLGDLIGLLDTLQVHEPIIAMGCSMGGGLVLDYALANPGKVRGMILVGAGPSGLRLDVPQHPKAGEAEEAYTAGELDKVAELETQIWFDGMGRTAEQVDPEMRRLAYEMNRLGLSHDAKHLGKRLPDTDLPAAERLAELKLPVLVIVGEHDTPYILAAADHMAERLPLVRKVVVGDAAHLANLDHPDVFEKVVRTFLDTLPS